MRLSVDRAPDEAVVFVSNSSDIVLWDDHIHDNGDFSIAGELDIHGVGASETQRLWIVDSHLHHNRGDSMQFGHRAGNTLNDFYIGRNDMHDDGENCVDIKEASNPVISENRLHSPAEGMPAVVLHDCPLNGAVIYNEIYDAAVGVSMASLEDACASHQPVTLMVLRNEMHDLSDTGVQGWGAGKRYFVAGNSFTSVSTPIEIDNAGEGSQISEGDESLEAGFTAFETIYGLDISAP